MVLSNVSAAGLVRVHAVFLRKPAWMKTPKIQKQQGDPKEQKLAHKTTHHRWRKLRSDCSISSKDSAQNRIAW